MKHSLVGRCYDHAAVCPCAGDRSVQYNAIGHVSLEAAQEAGLHPEREEHRPLSAPPRLRRTHCIVPASTDPADVSTREASVSAAWDFAVTFCLRPAACNPGPPHASQPNSADYETHTSTTTQPPDAKPKASASAQSSLTGTRGGWSQPRYPCHMNPTTHQRHPSPRPQTP